MNMNSIERLRDTCGLGGPVEVSVVGPAKEAIGSKTLFLPFGIIGRDEQADLFLDDPRVSRRHAYVQFIAGRGFVIDLLSRSGTRVSGAPIRSAWVDEHEVVHIAAHAFQFYSGLRKRPGGGQHNPLTAPTLCDYAEPEFALEISNGATSPQYWQMETVLALLGRRASGFGLAINDPEVSGFHASLLRTSEGVWLFDLLGQDGVLLNGRRVRWALVTDRDVIQMGNHRFRAIVTSGCQYGAKSSNGSDRNGTLQGVVHGERVMTNGRQVGHPNGTLVALPSVSAKPPVTRDFLVSLFDQFATVQNQMFDQFQGAMTMMVDMFSEMQRDQVSLIRKEVDRLHTVTEEIHKLQSELVKRAAAPQPVKERRAKTAPRPPAKVRNEDDVPKVASTPDASPAPPLPESKNQSPAPAGFGLPAQEENADSETHEWLYDKISELQRERQSRFHKIFSFLTGK